ncbi:MAG: family 43 glycosylhydrolase, partial [Acetatifactor sp.]|nr:family 43 glycosylhydrolase [Acetatifactor sp.]
IYPQNGWGDLSGELWLAGQESCVAFESISVVNDDTQEEMEFEDVVLTQKDIGRKLGAIDCSNYTISLTAKELEGFKGFEISFAKKNEQNRLFWLLGGWENGDSYIGEDINGKNSVLTQRTRHVEKGRSYQLKIKVCGNRVTTYVDGTLELETEILPPVMEPIYFASSKEKASGDIILKLVNVLPEAQKIQIRLTGMKKVAGKAYLLNSYVREEKEISFDSNEFLWEMPAETVCVLRVHEAGLYADPDLIKVGDTYYLYPTTDGFENWSGSVFHAFSSKDLKTWKDEGVILDVASVNVPWAVGYAWAPAVYVRDGRYYLYFCAKRADGVSCIGVAISENPVGGFFAMEEPIVTPEMLETVNIHVNQTIDPSVYEEDGEVYLLFGNGTPAVGKLSSDFCHLELPTVQTLEGAYDFREAISVINRDGRYHFTWSCDDTGSENYHVNYGVSDSLWGPIEYKYSILTKKIDEDILGVGHHCILKEPDEDRYHIAFHRFATPTKEYPDGKGYHRELCIGAVEFDENGWMLPVGGKEKPYVVHWH